MRHGAYTYLYTTYSVVPRSIQVHISYGGGGSSRPSFILGFAINISTGFVFHGPWRGGIRSNQNLEFGWFGSTHARTHARTHAPWRADILHLAMYTRYPVDDSLKQVLRLFPVLSIYLLPTLLSLPTCRRKVHKVENKSR